MTKEELEQLKQKLPGSQRQMDTGNGLPVGGMPDSGGQTAFDPWQTSNGWAQNQTASAATQQPTGQIEQDTDVAQLAGIPAVGQAQIRGFNQALQAYKVGKANLERRIIDNEQWWKLRHSDGMQNTTAADADKSAWLANVIMTKHADAMDAYPTCTCLPQEAGDVQEAQKLSGIVPVVLRRTEFEKIYSDVWWQKLKGGTGCYKIVWDRNKLGGLGDVAIQKVNLLNLFWEPGVEDIQDSTYVFHVELWNRERLKERYSQVDEKAMSNGPLTLNKFVYDDTVRTDDKALVVDCYYKKQGKLQFCKYVGTSVLYATENEPDMAERGLYDHGQYPFVLDPLFPIEGSCCGYGYIDYGKTTQHYIDKLTGAIMQNALAAARPRWFVRSDGGVNEEEYADFNNAFVHANGNLGEDSIRQMKPDALPGIYLNVLESRIQELKETLGNRDASTGGVTASVTSASGIASLQEAAGKLSRDAEKASYRAFEQIVYMVIELIRQFYNVARTFRITGNTGQETFVSYDNSGIAAQSQGSDFGQDMGIRVPQFDIDVQAQKENPYTKESYNELAVQLYQLGVFNPQMANQALMMLDLMDFKGKTELVQKVQKQNQFMQIVQQAMAILQAQQARQQPAESAEQNQDPRQSAGGDLPSGGEMAGAQSSNPADHPFVNRAREQTRSASQPR